MWPTFLCLWLALSGTTPRHPGPRRRPAFRRPSSRPLQVERLEHRWCPSYTLVTSRAALAGTDAVDWGTLGPTTVASPFTIISTGGVGINVSKVRQGSFLILEQVPLTIPGYDSWHGNFAPGDVVLYNNQTTVKTGDTDPITLDFGSTAVAAGGAQIQAGAYGVFTAKVEAFDASGVRLASFTEKGRSSGDADNSAIFIGISSTSATIHKIVLSLTKSHYQWNSQFAINKFDFRTSAAAAATATPTAEVLSLAPTASLDPTLILPSSFGPLSATPSASATTDTTPTVMLPLAQAPAAPSLRDRVFAAAATAQADAAPWDVLALGLL